MSKTVTRLYEQFRPENYKLSLAIDPDTETFTGTVIITGKKVGRPSQRVTFHQKDLKVIKAEIVRIDKNGRNQIKVERINLHKGYDEVRLHSKDMVYPGNYEISLEFEGKITKSMNGIYPCLFKHDGKDKKLIATQFESHHAREAFPCVDEPEAKATFDLTLITPDKLIALSNTPASSQKTSGKLQTTAFETTPKMSTYLLAFVFGEMHCVNDKTKRGVEVRSWATIAQPKSHLTYANNEAIDLLEFFEDYFKTPFPLPKLDQVGLPDFDSLAMENWGLITFREVGLLADPVNRSISGERLITQVIAHELSHQWFGNLVTMKWWDDLWLNESFATVMESLGPDKLHPDWQEWEDFTSTRVLGCVFRDIYKDVQPVGVKVNNPDEILSLFDPSIVYAKGARVLKMLFDYIGEATFSEGLAIYFKKHAYGNTTRSDLWAALGESSKLDIEKLMTPWIEQSGTPEITVKSSADKITLQQKRFLLDGNDADSLWPIPLLADAKLEPDVLTTRRGEFKTKNVPTFNPNGSGHFITRYEDSSVRNRMEEKIKDGSLPSSGRIIALSDRLLEAQADRGKLTDILDLIKDCKHEDRDAVWSMFNRVMGSVALLSDGEENLDDKLKELRRNLTTEWYEKLGWTDKKLDDPNIKNLRTTALAMSVGGENQAAIKTALDKFEKAKDVASLPAEQRGLIAGAAIRFGKPTYVNQLMSEYESSHSADVKESIAGALCSTKDEKVAKRIISWGMNNPKIIRLQDIDHWFAYLMRNRHTREVAWNWMVNNWSYLIEQFGESKHMEYFVWYSSFPLSSKTWQKRHRDFFEPKLYDVSMKRNILIAFSEIQARVDWRERELPELKKFFNV